MGVKKSLRKKFSLLVSLTLLMGLLVLLPFLTNAAQVITHWLSKATGTPARIVITANQLLQPVNRNWSSFAQGGEESTDMIKPAISVIKKLAPQYIRIDHIFDRYVTVTRAGSGTLQFDFSKLDEMVKSIQATGATPFFSLSYMPPELAIDGVITNAPRNWNDWAQLTRATIEHYSGKQNLNISNVYYEVWNEPDLFGHWKYNGDKNYLTLYTYAATGANQAQNTNAFKIGGPATTQLYRNWIQEFLKNATENNLRVDFVSWHRYTPQPEDYLTDNNNLAAWLFPYPNLSNVERIISEAGINAEMDKSYDETIAFAHALATARFTQSAYAQIFAFELVDGHDPAGQKYWGRWGLLTHPLSDLTPKPRYAAFLLLNHLEGNYLPVAGEGTWVTSIATRKDNHISVLITNYDREGTHSETVPVTFSGLKPGKYTLTQTRSDLKPHSQDIAATSEWATEVILTANSAILLELDYQEIPNPFLGTQ